MSKRLKLFGLLALVLALGAGVAWADSIGSGSGTQTADVPFVDVAATTTFNSISGNATYTGSIGNGLGFNEVLIVSAAKDQTLTFAPRRVAAGALAGNREFVTGAFGNNDVQLWVNQGDNLGTVIINASNGNDPIGAQGALVNGVFTRYNGGTILNSGRLGITNNNSLGLGFVGLVTRNPDASQAPLTPTLFIKETNAVALGGSSFTDTGGVKAARQPLLLLYRNFGANPDLGRLTTAVVEVGKKDEVLQKVELRDGIAEGSLTAEPAYVNAAADTPAAIAITSRSFARLVKRGEGDLTITRPQELAPAAIPALGWVAVNTAMGLDGAFHTGGTVVEAGTLELFMGNASTKGDLFRGSLGKTWTTFQGSLLNPAGPYSEEWFINNRISNAVDPLDLYNPLLIQGSGKVIVDRSQFFSQFTVAKDASFEGKKYTYNGVNLIPQITTTLDRFHNRLPGLLKGKFDLVIASLVPSSRPGVLAGLVYDGSDDPNTPSITADAQAALFIDREENQITEGDTLVANGILSIASNKSIGPGQVTIGATGGNGKPDRGFTTPGFPALPPGGPSGLATFAASKTFKLENVAVTQGQGNNTVGFAALAAEREETLTFKNITVNGRLLINPATVPSNAVVGGVPVLGPRMPGSWFGTVAFGVENAAGSDDVYQIAGVDLAPTSVIVERGTWHLDTMPTKTTAQATGNLEPLANVTLFEDARLSLGKEARDFSKNMDLTLANAANVGRIRVIVKPEDLADSRNEALRQRTSIFKARNINYNGLGMGDPNSDRRLYIELDLSLVKDKLDANKWINAISSVGQTGLDCLHYVRPGSGTSNEDKVKIVVGFIQDGKEITNIDLGKDNTWTGEQPIDATTRSILLPVVKNFDGTKPDVPAPMSPDVKPDGPEISAPATVEVGKTVTFTLGDWYYNKKKLAAGDIKDIVWMLDGKDVTAQVKGNKLEVNAPAAEGTMTLEIKGKLVSDPTKELSQKKSVTVKKAGTTPTPTPTPDGGGSSGGCDAGFGALGLALAAAFLLKRKA